MLLPSSWSPKLPPAVSDGLPESKERAGSAGVLKNPPCGACGACAQHPPAACINACANACGACASNHDANQTYWSVRPMVCFPASALSIPDTLARALLLSASSIQPFATQYLLRSSRVTACTPFGTAVVFVRSVGNSRIAVRRISTNRRWFGLSFLPAPMPAQGTDTSSIGTTTGACAPLGNSTLSRLNPTCSPSGIVPLDVEIGEAALLALSR